MLKTFRFRVLVILLILVAVCSIYKHNMKSNKSDFHISENFTDDSISDVNTCAVTTDIVSHYTDTAVSETIVTDIVVTDIGAGDYFHDNVSFEEDDLMTASEPYISEKKISEVIENMRAVSALSDDLIGWIFIADTDIDYPIVQGNDNQYYLHHTPDGRDYDLGTIFLDYRNKNDFSDPQSILFGHNMQKGMFGDIRRLKDENEFASHRYGWLFTKEYLYRIDFFALSVVNAYDSIYDVPTDNVSWTDMLIENSLYATDDSILPENNIIALSTCTAADFDNARALFAGVLVKEQEIAFFQQ